ncbi:NAD-dependent epimerase [Flavobacterium suaedae]|uniref:NAD-dependent epimerase n=1 Tax=Flavobacterium suaedae TaxID=1767027 RepID=A0ABQ1JHP7_9FLAO|nr:NAD-dependent epimerase/dehydratase family protein [Flavobacterium suaedae]GGB69283.1 NAD-dependent epimerase [Flavobacterium suaedae]
MILVTGGTGLVGAHLLLQLTEGNIPIRALYRTASRINKTKNLFSYYEKASLFEKIEWVKGDINNIPSLEKAFKGITHVYHCAACVSFDPSDEDLLRKVNIEGTANIVNFCIDYGIKKLCHVSSIAALGDAKEHEPTITEETEWNPEVKHDDYAISKHGAEMEVWRGWQEGIDVVIVNPGIVFGYGFATGSGAMFKTVYNGLYFYTKGSCGVVAVEDVTNIMIKLMESSITGERYTVVGTHLSYREILFAIADGMNKKRPPVYATKLMSSIAWRMDWLFAKLLRRKRFLTRFMANSSHSHYKYDNSKIKNELGYNFTEMKSYIKQLAENFKPGSIAIKK